MQHGVDVLRRFNRSYTQRIGALDDSYLGSGRPLGTARLLFEIGPQGARVRELRDRLGLDSGYVSRMLRALEADGLVAVEPDAVDRRRRAARLTAAGRREWRRLDRRSDELARRLLAPLSDHQRSELDQALATADRLLRVATIEVEHVDPRSRDARWAVTQYFAELHERFPAGFDPGDALDEDAIAFAAASGRFVLARSELAPVGCGGIRRVDDATAEIKRMWIGPAWRGLGLGRRLLRHLETTAGELGYRRVVLDTNQTLREAIALYEAAGYHSIERYNENPYAQRWFAKDLVSRGAARTRSAPGAAAR